MVRVGVRRESGSAQLLPPTKKLSNPKPNPNANPITDERSQLLVTGAFIGGGGAPVVSCDMVYVPSRSLVLLLQIKSSRYEFAFYIDVTVPMFFQADATLA